MAAVEITQKETSIWSNKKNILTSKDKLNRHCRVASKNDVESSLEQLTDYMTNLRRDVFRKKLHRYVRKPDRELIIAVAGDCILGLACVIFQKDPPEGFESSHIDRLKEFAFNTQLMVHPPYRNQGIGFNLQRYSLQWAEKRGRVGHWLITHRMADWYKRHFNYKEIGRVHMQGVEKIGMIRTFKKNTPY